LKNTVEDDLLARSLNFIDRAHSAGKPFLLWHNTTRMHVWTRLSERWRDKIKFGLYADGMQELDWVVGELLGKLDALGIADDTIVIFTTDNGAEEFSWRDGGTSPFRGEKGLGWEGGFRAPFAIRWPGNIPAGQDHDITFDPVSVLTKQQDPDGLIDFRSPALDLDNIYGRGPGDQPYMYDGI
jgi:arylsulfatase A-like enzyme